MKEKKPSGSNPDSESSESDSGRDDSGQIAAISFHLNFPVFLLNHYLGGREV